MSNGAGIQELMAAETRASQIVAEARIGKHYPFIVVSNNDKKSIIINNVYTHNALALFRTAVCFET
jgi:hypothetical protein